MARSNSFYVQQYLCVQHEGLCAKNDNGSGNDDIDDTVVVVRLKSLAPVRGTRVEEVRSILLLRKMQLTLRDN